MIVPSTATATLGALDAALTLGIEDADHVIIQSTGTWVGTLTPEISVDGTNWVATAIKSSTQTNSTTLITSWTSNGISQLYAVGIPYFRVRMSAYTSGSAVITVHVDRSSK